MQEPKLEAVVIGGSSGALDALRLALPALPADFPWPVTVVLHLLPTRPSGLAEALQGLCALRTKEAEDKEPLQGGTLYVAAPNYHLLIERERCFSLSVDDPVWFSRPAIDVLFESAADAFGKGLLGVLLSGANEDGAQGLARIRANGGLTVVQAPDSATSRPMPDAALRLGAADHVLPPAEIGALLARFSRETRGVQP